jgi:hypothetical protein
VEWDLVKPDGAVKITRFSDLVCTSYIERANLTMRTHCKRVARLTLAFSKKLHNFKAAMALNLAYYNLVKTHGTLRCTPAMAAGVESSACTVADLVNASYKRPEPRGSD